MEYIYFLYDPTWKSECFYIGKTKSLQKRLAKHLLPSELISSTVKNNWIKKLLSNGIKPQIYLICEVPKYLSWQEAEKEWISFFKLFDIKLLNGTLGGDGYDWTGMHHSEKTKNKLSEIMISRFKAKPFSEEIKIKISNANTGQIRTDAQKMNYRKPKTKQHKENISISKMGYQFTEQHKNNISKSKIGKTSKFKNLPRTEEVKQKIKNAKAANPCPSPNKGKKLSDDHKRKLSIARCGKKFGKRLVSYKNKGIALTDEQKALRKFNKNNGVLNNGR